jgi:protein TonB
MSPTVGGVVTGHLAFRAATLAVSAVAHVLVYGALSLAPAGPPSPRTVLFVTDLVVIEAPAPVNPAPRLITPPRPVVRKPPKSKVEPASAEIIARVEEPPITAAAEPVREVVETPTAPTPAAPTMQPAPATPAQSMAPAAPPQSSTTPATNGTLAAMSSPVTQAAHGGSAAIAALPPAPSPAEPGPPTRTAIPRGGYQVTPSYPAAARRLGIEGTALLRVFVDAEGRVGDVVVKQSAGHPDLDRAAADAVRRWRFEPARRGADTVAMWVELPVAFHLR